MRCTGEDFGEISTDNNRQKVSIGVERGGTRGGGGAGPPPNNLKGGKTYPLNPPPPIIHPPVPAELFLSILSLNFL